MDDEEKFKALDKGIDKVIVDIRVLEKRITMLEKRIDNLSDNQTDHSRSRFAHGQ